MFAGYSGGFVRFELFLLEMSLGFVFVVKLFTQS